MKKFMRLALVASVLYGMGAHWAALQGAAWGRMLASRASESSWADAVTSTFSGEKPCHVCKVVEKGSTFDKGSLPLRPGAALDILITVAARMRAEPPASACPAAPAAFLSYPSARPVVPPPKPLLA